MSKWYYLDESIPADGQSCYIRLSGNEFTPIPCIYNASSEIFTCTVNAATYELAEVLKWSPNP